MSGFPTYERTEADKNAALFQLNNTASKSLSDRLDELIVHSLQLPLTIDGLNKTKFTPKSVNENLEAGVLQLVDGSLVLVDETTLDEGQLVDPGVRNFQALHNLIQNQTLSYEFPYSQYDFDTDLNVISLSTSKSMLPVSCAPFRTSSVKPLTFNIRIIALFVLNLVIHLEKQKTLCNPPTNLLHHTDNLFMLPNTPITIFLKQCQR